MAQSYYEAPPINTMSTPASGVAGALQEMISRRAFEKRQAMLDELTRQQKEAQLAVAQENAASLKAYREAQSEEKQARAAMAQEKADLSKLDRLAPGQIQDPGTISWLKEKFPESVRTSGGGSLVEGEQGPLPPEQVEFLGSPSFRQQQQENQALMALEGNEEFQKASPLGKWLMMRSVVSDAKDLGNLAPLMKQEQEGALGVIDPQGRVTIHKGLPPNLKTVELSRPPQGPQPQFIGTDPETGMPVFHQGGSPYITQGGKRVPFTGALGAKPSASVGKLGDITPAETAAIQKASRAAEASKRGYFGTTFGAKPEGDPAAMADLRQRQIGAAYGLAPRHPEVRAALAHALNDPATLNANPTTLAEAMALEGEIPNTPAAKLEFANALQAVLKASTPVK